MHSNVLAGATKYHRWYNWLVGRAVCRPLEAYTERHHIVPSSLGGRNDRSNIVRLTYREHFLAHWLLVKMTTGADRRKMRYALYRMSGEFDGRTIAGWQYAVARMAQRDAKLGSKHRPEHRAKISASLAGNKRSLGFKQSEDLVQRRREWMRGNAHSLGFKHSAETLAKRGPASEETKRRMSEAQRARWAKRLDRTVSAESRAKMSAAMRARNAKGPPSAETRAKLSASIKASWAKRKGVTP